MPISFNPLIVSEIPETEPVPDTEMSTLGLIAINKSAHSVITGSQVVDPEIMIVTFCAPPGGVVRAVTPQPTATPIPDGYVEYFTQSGDTLAAVAAHFGVKITEIESEGALDPALLIDGGTRLLVRDVLEETTPSDILFPDAAVVFSPAVMGFDVQEFADARGVHLSTYSELMTRGTTPASEILAQTDILIGIDLGQGDAQTTFWTSDLSHGYVDINAHYRT